MTPTSITVVGLLMLGVSIGIVVQRFRRAFQDWRKTVRSIPLLKAVAAQEGQRAAAMILVGLVVVYAVWNA